MYGSGASDGEWDEVEFESAKVKNDLDRAKVAQAEATVAVNISKLADTVDESDLDAAFPWPKPGNRSLTPEERLAIWVRASIIAGRPLPKFTAANSNGSEHNISLEHPDDRS
jgi:hypothetical protein